MSLSTTARPGAAAKSDATQQVRQKFSHGRTRAVTVEVKKPIKRPTVTATPAPARAPVAVPAAAPAPAAAAPRVAASSPAPQPVPHQPEIVRHSPRKPRKTGIWVVLAILAEKDSYGYAILKRVQELSGGRMEWTDGMLYPVLHRMEHRGLIKSRWGEGETGRKRKYYSLKKGGKTAMVRHHEQWSLVHSVLSGLRKEQYV